MKQNVLNILKIRDLMRKKEISQKELAENLGFSTATISDWLNGKKKPSEEHLVQLADELDAAVEEITSEQPPIVIGEKSIVYNSPIYNYATVNFYSMSDVPQDIKDLIKEYLDQKNDENG